MYNNIKMNVNEIWLECMEWIILTKHRDEWRAVVISVMNVKVKKDAWSVLTGRFTCSV